MKLFGAAFVIFLGLTTLAGCSADGSSGGSDLPTEPDTSGAAKKSPSASSGSSSSGGDNGHYTVPTDEPGEPADPNTPPPTTPADPDPPGTTPTTPNTPLTSKCTAADGGNKSVSTLDAILDNGVFTLSKLSVEMTNKDNRNKNDIDVFVTPKNGSETKVFNSGDILPAGKTTDVPLPATFKPTAGSKIRIETNFDQAFSDPSASCVIQL